MNYSKQYISELGSKSGFINSNIEKVVRLIDVLQFIDTQLDPNHDKLVLKGGTAINLLYMNLPRLSVDIDLDYIGSLNKEKALEDREIIINCLDNFMIKEGYLISPKSRNSIAVTSRTYSFLNAFGNKDNIKVEINFIDRIHIYNEERKEAFYFGKKISISVPAKEELFGMKLCALIDRGKPRDLYDVNKIMLMSKELDLEKIKKSTLFYLSLDGVFNIDETIFEMIKNITLNEIKKELLPVLALREKFELEEIKTNVIKWIRNLLNLTDDEKQYFRLFSKGEYIPFLFFDDATAKKVLHHPMAKWRVYSSKKQN